MIMKWRGYNGVRQNRDGKVCCDCKGTRSCLECELIPGIKKKNFKEQFEKLESFVYCHFCNKLIPGSGWSVTETLDSHCLHDALEKIDFPGVLVKEDFISNDEEQLLIDHADKHDWKGSQSGRRKQNYGPKVNFKKKILKSSKEIFNGFPLYSKFVQDRFSEIPLLENFKSIEQCFLEYETFRGAQIEPHCDDCWIWGERIVTVNLLSDSVITLVKHRQVDKKQYNLDEMEKYKESLILKPNSQDECDTIWNDRVIRIAMPRKSILVLYGPARYNWEHCVLREDIVNRRIGICYREFTPPYLPTGDLYAKEVLDLAENFF